MSEPNNDSALPICKIPGNPDIAGIGVRIAVYLQALLAVLTFGYLLRTYVTEGPLLIERYIQAKVNPNTVQEAPPSPPDNEQNRYNTSTPPLSQPELEGQPQAEPILNPEQAEDGANEQLLSEDNRGSIQRTRTELFRRHRKSEMDTLVRFTNRGKRTDEDQACLDMSRSLGRSVILIGAAVLVSSFLQAKTRNDGLSHYHALIILNISWINCWCAILVGIISKYLSAKNFILKMYLKSVREGDLVRDETYMMSKIPFFVALFLDEAAFIIHVYVMCALGLWFWAKPNNSAFTKYLSDDEINPTPCRPMTYYWLFKEIPQSSRGLRIGSLVAYSLFAFIHLPPYHIQLFGMAVPILTIFITLLPAIVILTFTLLVEIMIFGISSLLTKEKRRRIGPLLIRCQRAIHYLSKFNGITGNQKREEETREARHAVYSIIGKLSIPLFLIGATPFVWFVVATEKLISANSANVLEGELDWTYGQTLALFSAIVAAFSFAGSMWSVIKERRRIQKEQELLDSDEEKAEPLLS